MNYPLISDVLSSLVKTPPRVQSSCVDGSPNQHELDTMLRFQEAGFRVLEGNAPKKDVESKYWPGTSDYLKWQDNDSPLFIPEMSIIRHPFGRFRPTDFAIRERGSKIHLLENKSSEDDVGNIHFSASLPHSSIIYLLSDVNKTILLYGNQLVSDEEYLLWEGYERNVNAVPKPYSDCVSAWIRICYKIMQSRCLFEKYGELCTQVVLDRLMGIDVESPMIVKNWGTPINMWRLSTKSVDIVYEEV